MKISKIVTVVFICMMLAGGLFVFGCKDGCPGGGGCYFIIANEDYNWCGTQSCSVWESNVSPGQATISCNC